MSRSRPFPLLVLPVLLVLFAVPAQAQSMDDVRIEATQVAEGIFMLTGRGGNIGVSAGQDGVLLIDDQFAPLTDKIRAAVAQLDKGAIRFVVNTHLHGDHTGGNENLAGAGAIIVAHDNVRRRMSVEQVNDFGRTPPAPRGALPVVTFPDTVTFHFNGEEIHVLHVPQAHTDGDSVLHFRRGDVIHTGDIVFNGLYPYIDVSAGGSVEGVIAAVDRILELAGESTKIIPGHGPLATPKDLEAYRAMLAAIRGRVAALMAEGKDLDAILDAAPTSAFDEVWGGGFLDPAAFTRIVHKSLTR